jgi:hypothetical protein
MIYDLIECINWLKNILKERKNSWLIIKYLSQKNLQLGPYVLDQY